jgi:antitoxin MazE
MKATLKKWGNSLACRIPGTLAKECGLSEESQVVIIASDGKLIISKVETLPVYSLEQLVSRITPENKHNYTDTDFGVPVGRELL